MQLIIVYRSSCTTANKTINLVSVISLTVNVLTVELLTGSK